MAMELGGGEVSASVCLTVRKIQAGAMLGPGTRDAGLPALDVLFDQRTSWRPATIAPWGQPKTCFDRSGNRRDRPGFIWRCLQSRFTQPTLKFRHPVAAFAGAARRYWHAAAASASRTPGRAQAAGVDLQPPGQLCIARKYPAIETRGVSLPAGRVDGCGA